MHNHTADILIIGGGIAGCMAAIALSERYDVMLIDKQQQPCQRIGESLVPAASRVLDQLDLLGGMDQGIFQRNMGMQSQWGSDEWHIVDHFNNPDGMVMSLDRQAFEAYLRSRAKQRGIHCQWGGKFEACDRQASQWHITINTNGGQNHITAAFVIDATGRQSHVARKLGIKRHQTDKLTACWASLPNQQHNTMSSIVSCQQGWWYSAVVPNQKRVLAFHSDADLIDKRLASDQQHFMDFACQHDGLSQLLKSHEDKLCLHGMVAANSSALKQVAGPGWAALGDAAISFDPLSSQGMFNAMASALQLRDLLFDFEVINGNDDQTAQAFERAYTQQINQIWMHYLHHKDVFYGQEQRWADAPFWQRRHASLTGEPRMKSSA